MIQLGHVDTIRLIMCLRRYEALVPITALPHLCNVKRRPVGITVFRLSFGLVFFKDASNLES